MGTLSSELAPHLGKLSAVPRVYVDANMPAGGVVYMRERLGWDVLFVMEHEDLRRARDLAHYRLARQLRRTLLTLDRDYFDDRQFPPQESGGVIVVTASDERALARVLTLVDRHIFRAARPIDPTDGGDTEATAPLIGRKLHVHIDWPDPDPSR
jgi:hypothetical protein